MDPFSKTGDPGVALNQGHARKQRDQCLFQKLILKEGELNTRAEALVMEMCLTGRLNQNDSKMSLSFMTNSSPLYQVLQLA